MKHKICALILAGTLLLGGATTAYAKEMVSFEAVRVGAGSSTPSAYAEPELEKQPVSNPQEEIDLIVYAEEVFRLTNEEREKTGLSTLKSDPVLTEMAMLRAKELEESYSHTRPNGENCRTVFGEYETDLRFYGENAAKGQKTPEKVVNAWMNSPGHKANLLREKAEYLGVGVWQDEGGVLHWVQLFAKD